MASAEEGEIYGGRGEDSSTAASPIYKILSILNIGCTPLTFPRQQLHIGLETHTDVSCCPLYEKYTTEMERVGDSIQIIRGLNGMTAPWHRQWGSEKEIMRF